MAKLVIQGLAPYNGEWELDKGRTFNAREWRWIKHMSGYMPLTMREGFAGGDPDLYLALACIAMCRNGKIDRDDGMRVWEELSERDTTNASITLMASEADEEADEVPLDITPPPDEPSQTG